MMQWITGRAIDLPVVPRIFDLIGRRRADAPPPLLTPTCNERGTWIHWAGEPREGVSQHSGDCRAPATHRLRLREHPKALWQHRCEEHLQQFPEEIWHIERVPS